MDYLESEKCTIPEGIGRVAEFSELEASFDSKQPFTFSMQHLKISLPKVESCIVAGSFSPSAGGRYITTFTSRGDYCYISFESQGIENNLTPERTFIARNYKSPMFASQGFCEPLTSSQKETLKK
jgi:hypothetical protein